MSEKRKDSKGCILRTGESQRKNGLYQYRYNDIHGKRPALTDEVYRSLKNLLANRKEVKIETMVGGYS